MPSRHLRAARPVRNRRKVIWANSLSANVALASATNITPIDLLAGLEAGGVGIVGGTVMRQHLWLSLNCINADTAPSFVWGTIMYSKHDVGTTDPDISNVADEYLHWLMLRQISPGTAPNAVATPAAAPTGTLYGAEYDIRARRRINEMGESLFFCLRNEGSQSASYSLFARTLVALP